MTREEVSQVLDTLIKDWANSRVPAAFRRHISINQENIDKLKDLLPKVADEIEEDLITNDGIDMHKRAAVFLKALHDNEVLDFSKGTQVDTPKWREHCRRDLACIVFFALLDIDIKDLQDDELGSLKSLLKRHLGSTDENSKKADYFYYSMLAHLFESRATLACELAKNKTALEKALADLDRLKNAN
ncbi:MAG: hypothetical protein A2527_04225 [Candidatus Lambdaproteobacteria bacterium RIFOXYD2_FULL_50_16]|uniref:RsbT co-antagonist protein RsbRD N-terminal domain-containing protein n=1 Tax=Candidatus Lambdaproteobacteria bacterium RIFOXYD2_FULL_50_16 TaxID=1817772 RepID=A0A1F6GFC4_9PROT|nr:MAG: hypothetical protein A2527_04225 [Candidatus Lambdaproteobacteria bacterium RIFOXYD2_FULL_50_16]